MKQYRALEDIPCWGYTIRKGETVWGWESPHFDNVVRLRIAEMVIVVPSSFVVEVNTTVTITGTDINGDQVTETFDPSELSVLAVPRRTFEYMRDGTLKEINL